MVQLDCLGERTSRYLGQLGWQSLGRQIAPEARKPRKTECERERRSLGAAHGETSRQPATAPDSRSDETPKQGPWEFDPPSLRNPMHRHSPPRITTLWRGKPTAGDGTRPLPGRGFARRPWEFDPPSLRFPHSRFADRSPGEASRKPATAPGWRPGETPDTGPWEFDPPSLRHNHAGVAQRPERCVANAETVGSNPTVRFESQSRVRSSIGRARHFQCRRCGFDSRRTLAVSTHRFR
jgi:hypothetical protein